MALDVRTLTHYVREIDQGVYFYIEKSTNQPSLGSWWTRFPIIRFLLGWLFKKCYEANYQICTNRREAMNCLCEKRVISQITSQGAGQQDPQPLKQALQTIDAHLPGQSPSYSVRVMDVVGQILNSPFPARVLSPPPPSARSSLSPPASSSRAELATRPSADLRRYIEGLMNSGKGDAEILASLREYANQCSLDTFSEFSKLHKDCIFQLAKQSYWKTLHFLVIRGVDPRLEEDGNQMTLLHYAAIAGKEANACLDRLLQAGADPNARNTSGETPLYYAVAKDSSAVDLLLEHNADPNIYSHAGWYPIHKATENRDSSTDVAWIIESLLTHGADINQQTKEGNTCLHLVAQTGNAGNGPLIDSLLKKGADLNIPNNQDEYPKELWKDTRPIPSWLPSEAVEGVEKMNKLPPPIDAKWTSWKRPAVQG